MITNGGIRNGGIKGYDVSKSITLVIIVIVSLMMAGCALIVVGAAAGAGVAYVKGDLQASVAADPRAVEKASLKTFEALDIRKISSRGSAVDAEIVGRTATDKKVLIKAKSGTEGESALSIRIGTFGDEMMSRRIYDELKVHLPAATRELE